MRSWILLVRQWIIIIVLQRLSHLIVCLTLKQGELSYCHWINNEWNFCTGDTMDSMLDWAYKNRAHADGNSLYQICIKLMTSLYWIMALYVFFIGNARKTLIANCNRSWSVKNRAKGCRYTPMYMLCVIYVSTLNVSTWKHVTCHNIKFVTEQDVMQSLQYQSAFTCNFRKRQIFILGATWIIVK